MTRIAVDAWQDTFTGEIHYGDYREVGILPDPKLGGWQEVESPLPGQYAYVHRNRGLIAMFGAGTHGGKIWLHVSVRHKSRLPTWEEVTFTKDSLLGEECQAIQIFPPKSRWVNVHPHVLHLWVCVEGDGIPQFEEHGLI